MKRLFLGAGLILLGKELQSRADRRRFESMLAGVRRELDRVERYRAREAQAARDRAEAARDS